MTEEIKTYSLHTKLKAAANFALAMVFVNTSFAMMTSCYSSINVVLFALIFLVIIWMISISFLLKKQGLRNLEGMSSDFFFYPYLITNIVLLGVGFHLGLLSFSWVKLLAQLLILGLGSYLFVKYAD